MSKKNKVYEIRKFVVCDKFQGKCPYFPDDYPMDYSISPDCKSCSFDLDGQEKEKKK